MRLQLREQTREPHQRLDDFVGSLDPFNRLDSYQVYLTAMHRLYQNYGVSLDTASQWAGLEPPTKLLMSCLENDLGFRPRRVECHVKNRRTDAETWAAAYVLEGSAMGARHILKSLDGTTPFPMTYLETLASDSYSRWSKFVAALEQCDCNIEPTANAAVRVFEVAYEIFSELANERQLAKSIQSPNGV